MTLATRHECPVDGCGIRVRTDLLMCRNHWYQVRGDLRRAVWYWWRNDPGSEQYLAARAEAVLYVNERLGGKGHD